ncbi:putative non-heme bromoperoxidase BpoC [Microbacterium azadirachtae]|uniref:Putative non-heme bromoperoxidase BpoC n=1 Tax=Microbacterium azadirachtae TaxID=582680 RepID=A0A0F0KTV9_9MICO|nr:alpha/beta hydrolase [Microbacterium azadirachtae]KJL24298.1 putative non-heme bromoperoxidase BpoC [Microbacterium azadirachtae]
MSALTDEWVRTTDGADLHLEIVEGRRPVLLLNGLGYASWAAAPLRAALAPDVSVCALDNRGTGRSTRGNTPATPIEMLAEDAALAIERLGGPVPVIGYSMGGYIAQTLALSRPDLVERLVLIGTSAGGSRATPVPETTRAAWLETEDETPAQYARKTMPLSFREGWPDAHPEAYEALLAARLDNPTDRRVWQAQYQACERFLAVGVPTELISVPVLIIHGTNDRVLPVENGRAIANALPQRRYIEVPAGGHLLHLEDPDVIAREIVHLLS